MPLVAGRAAPPVRAAVGGGLAFLLLGLLASTYGPVLPDLRERFGLSAATGGLVLSAHFAGSVAGILCAAALYRRVRLARRFTLSLGLLALGAVAVALAPSWPAVLVAVSLAGLGWGGLELDVNLTFTAAYGARSGAVMNLMSAMFGLGAVGGPLLVAVARGSRPAVFLTVAVLAVAALPLLLAAPERPGPFPGTPTARRRAVWASFLLLFFLYVATETGVSGWMATHLEEATGRTAGTAAGWTAGFWLAFTLGRLLAAPVALRVAPARLVPACLVVATACLVAAHATAVSAPAFLLTGLFLAPVFPTALVWFGQRVPSGGGASASVVAGASFGPVLTSPLIGRVHDGAGVRAVPAALAVLACATTAVAVRLAAARR